MSNLSDEQIKEVYKWSADRVLEMEHELMKCKQENILLHSEVKRLRAEIKERAVEMTELLTSDPYDPQDPI